MQEHPELIKLIEQHHLHSPSAASVPLNLSHLPSEEELAGQKGQARSVEELLEGKTGGFFIEAGAWDGEALSNTLLFELNYNWTGKALRVKYTSKHRAIGGAKS